MSSPSRRPVARRGLLGVTALGLLAAGTTALASPPEAPDEGAPARTVPFQLVHDRDVDDRLPRPEDRYAMAGGCYTVEAPGSGWLARAESGLQLTGDQDAALALHFQATRLGEYLLATDEGPDTRWDGAWWDVRGYLAAGSPLPPPAAAVVPTEVTAEVGGSDVAVADAPSPDAEWRVVAAGDDPEAKGRGVGNAPLFAFSLPSRDAVLIVQDGRLRLAPSAQADPTPLVLNHVRDDDPADDDPDGAGCATWPEIATGASGKPEPVAAHAADRARGFFEAHVHGMAFEFLGGELRCGRPWHPYGVEHALGNCYEENNLFNGALEVPLGGYSGTDYDPVGWPTFGYWPQNRTLTHEQFYWRWLERAYAGGLRLMTNLLVDNTALCQAFPVKKNSCNEMDGVRLQAQRLFELQDYVDAQNGGPGEGWFRIVTTPAQARQVINDGRLAVVLGIEVSELFDCREVLDQPQCTAEQIDERLQEVFDMGVRQMELVNKFDNALTGVKGDAGTTGPVVNTGNKHVTGHFWDMRSCDHDGHDHDHGSRTYEGDEHDHTQIGPADATPEQAEGVDALAGRVLDRFGGVSSVVAPVYGPGPHCNTRGLTPLGEHLLRAMTAKGMIFDPDHMSARAQREALDLVEHEIAPAERAAAEREERAARQPSLISSHSWANDVTYQRIYALDGVVAPYANDAASYARDWLRLRRWAAEQASPGYDFGMGYGADTNGLGGQPAARRNPRRSLEYTPEGWQAPIGGVRLTQHTSGLRTFDVTTEGVAMYGLFADWYQEVALAAEELEPGGGAAIVDDMLDGAETYLQLWERAVYGGGDCVRDGSTLQVEDLHAALGANLEGFLRAVGQPVDRDGAAYRYCVEDGDGLAYVDVAFDAAGRPSGLVPAGPVPLQEAAAGPPAHPDDQDHAVHPGVHHGSGSAANGPAAAATGQEAAVLAAAGTSSPADGKGGPFAVALVLLLGQVFALRLVNLGRR